MAESDQEQRRVDQFILENIDSVSHLEALLLLWSSRPKQWSAEEMARRLYVDTKIARELLADLQRSDLIAAVSNSNETYSYETRSEERDQLIGLVDATYRYQIVRISDLIHSKGSSAVRDFARAFRFTKEPE
jgi:predicted ArsR family transcriptional regulator